MCLVLIFREIQDVRRQLAFPYTGSTGKIEFSDLGLEFRGETPSTIESVNRR